MHVRRRIPFTLAASLLAVSSTCLAQPADNGFTYQGRLTDAGSAPSGQYDLQFTLFTTPSGGVGSPPITIDNAQVTSGLFTARLDFGGPFDSQKHWLEIAVRPGISTGAFTTLNPRQEITAAPLATFSLAPWINVPALGIRYPSYNVAINAIPSFTDRFLSIGDSSNVYGVHGVSAGSAFNAAGVLGEGNGSNVPVGVFGRSTSGANGTGAQGLGTATGGYFSSTNPGDLAGTTSTGVYAYGGRYGLVAGCDAGVAVDASSISGTAVSGSSTSGTGVIGLSSGFDGVYGSTSANSHAGVAGVSTSAGSNSYGGFFAGGTYGAYGSSNQTTGVGVKGQNNVTGTSGSLGAQNSGVIGSGGSRTGVNALSSGNGLGAPALSAVSTGSSGIALTANANSSDSCTVLFQSGFGDILKCFGQGLFAGTLTPDATFRIGRDGDVIVDALGLYTTAQSFDTRRPRIRFGDISSGEWIASERGLTSASDWGGLSFSTANTRRMYIRNNGDFYVEGLAFKPGGGSWSTISDARLKKNIQPLSGSLDTLLSLRGASFEYLDPAAVHELPGTRLGFIAQDVERVIPDWVSTDDHGFKRVTIRGFEALAVEALRELRSESDARVSSLRAEVLRLHAQLDAQAADFARRLDKLESERAATSAETK